MSFLNVLKKKAAKYFTSNSTVFIYPYKKQKDYLDSFSEPRDDIDRSFFQYKAQAKINNSFLNFIMNLVAIPLVIFYRFSPGDNICHDDKKSAVFISGGMDNKIIPSELKKEFPDLIEIESKRTKPDKNGRRFFSAVVRRHPFSFYFQFKCLMKIRLLYHAIAEYSPRAILSCGEYSFASSVGTAFCELYGVENINVMHGEKLFYMRDSFFRFSRAYVWDEYYIKLFDSMKAPIKQFRVAVPDSLKFSKKQEDVIKKYDYTYYMGYENEEVMKKIAVALSQLRNNGYMVCVRPHPRFSDKDMMKRIFSDIEIENGDDINIETSVLRTKNAVSRYSSVLNQAYHNGIPIVIDDISSVETYKKLVELKYIMFNVEHKLLSQII